MTVPTMSMAATETATPTVLTAPINLVATAGDSHNRYG